MADIRQYILKDLDKIRIYKYNVTYPGVKEVDYKSTLPQLYDNIVFVQNQMGWEVEILRSDDRGLVFVRKRKTEKDFVEYVLLVED